MFVGPHVISMVSTKPTNQVIKISKYIDRNQLSKRQTPKHGLRTWGVLFNFVLLENLFQSLPTHILFFPHLHELLLHINSISSDIIFPIFYSHFSLANSQMDPAATQNAVQPTDNQNNHRNTNKRLREQWTEESPEAKKIREDLFIEILDSDDETEKSADNWNDIATKTDDLENFIKTFEQEISLPAPESKKIPELPTVDHQKTEEKIVPTSDELSFLLEASDDDLGLPPTSTSEEEKGKIDGSTFGQIWEFEDEKSIISDQFSWTFDERDNNYAGLNVNDDLDGPMFSDWPNDFIWRSV